MACSLPYQRNHGMMQVRSITVASIRFGGVPAVIKQDITVFILCLIVYQRTIHFVQLKELPVFSKANDPSCPSTCTTRSNLPSLLTSSTESVTSWPLLAVTGMVYTVYLFFATTSTMTISEPSSK